MNPQTMTSRVRERLAVVHERIEEALEKSGREPDEVRILIAEQVLRAEPRCTH